MEDGRLRPSPTASRIPAVFRRHPVTWTLALGALLLMGGLILPTLLPASASGVALETRDVVRTLVLVGRVRPPSRTRVGATVAGTVERVLVREGDRVGRGDVLVTLDDREAQAAVAQARASLAEVTAQAKATLEQAQNEADQAERDLQRTLSVFKNGALTQQLVEQAQQRADDARSRLEAARAQAGGGRNAAIVRAQAALEGARARLDLTRVVAPADGVVLTRDVEPGDAVQPGRTLLDLALDGPTELVVFPSEENLGQLHVGAPAIASADAYPDSTFQARVSLVAPSVDPSQGTVEVRLAVDRPPRYLRPEMTVSVNIEAGRRDHASVLPESVIRGLGTDSPWVAVVRDGRLTRQPVDIGLRTDRYVEILSGVAKGQLVVPPQDSPELGDKVRVHAASGS
jgi:HlyD family secretion protein